MNSIQNLQSSSTQRLLQQSSASTASRPDGLPPGLEKRIDSVLSTQNLTDDERTSLKSDLESAIQSAFDPNGSPPDRSKVESAVKEVFNKYGLDGDALAAELRPARGRGGPPPGGHGGAGCGVADSEYGSGSQSQLADLLQQFLDKYVSEASSNNSAATAGDSTATTTKSAATSTTSTSRSAPMASTHDLAQSLAQYLSTLAFGLDTQA